jgi:peptidyl-prolyl cis-trans isomerase B (cyclophilin B)
VRFVAPNGHRIDYTAVVETDFGPIEIALRPDRAPNHVRNFLALARAGYYDGLHFDRIIHEVSPDGTGEPFDAVEGGCPLGTGEAEGGSIGYWLKADPLDPAGKPVAVEPLPHEEGAVGASHGTDRDSAGCKFYITLCKAPFLDGNYTVFGKVTRGLDVARTMFHQPVVADEENPNSGHDRPQKPIVIRKVTIATHEATEDK